MAFSAEWTKFAYGLYSNGFITSSLSDKTLIFTNHLWTFSNLSFSVGDGAILGGPVGPTGSVGDGTGPRGLVGPTGSVWLLFSDFGFNSLNSLLSFGKSVFNWFKSDILIVSFLEINSLYLSADTILWIHALFWILFLIAVSKVCISFSTKVKRTNIQFSKNEIPPPKNDFIINVNVLFLSSLYNFTPLITNLSSTKNLVMFSLSPLSIFNK